jgi:NAD-dependent dihydropyrimidine dehydrogenase PreA subunit
MERPFIDQKKCIACGKCLEVCPVEVFEKRNNKVVEVKVNECLACRACERVCPVQAVNVREGNE